VPGEGLFVVPGRFGCRGGKAGIFIAALGFWFKVLVVSSTGLQNI